MSRIETVYRGHTIFWSDNDEAWTCFDLSDKVRTSPKLSAIKAQIDRLYLAERKSAAVACYELGRGIRTESNVIEFIGTKTTRPWSGGPGTTTYHVATVATRRGSSKPARQQTSLDHLMPVTPEADAAFAEYMRLYRIARAADDAANAAYAALPRMKPEDIQPLIDLYERDQTEGSAK